MSMIFGRAAPSLRPRKTADAACDSGHPGPCGGRGTRRMKNVAIALKAAVLLASAGLAAVGIAGSGARAAGTDLEFYTGADLMAQCAAAPPGAGQELNQARCTGYVMGVSDAIQAAQGAGGPGRICIAPSVGAPVLVASVRRFLKAHPQKREFAAQDLVREALSATYPCR